jgi:hypothetical protein
VKLGREPFINDLNKKTQAYISGPYVDDVERLRAEKARTVGTSSRQQDRKDSFSMVVI